MNKIQHALHTTRQKVRMLARATARISVVVAIFSLVVIVAWEQVDDPIEAKWEDWTTVTYVSAEHDTPVVPVDQEIERKQAIFIENIDMYWEDATQKYLQEQLEAINKKMEEVQPMDAQTFEKLKEEVRRTEVSL